MRQTHMRDSAASDRSRRDFLKLSLVSGAVMMAAPARAFAAAKGWPALSDGMALPLIRIEKDNSITIFTPNPDMGQGTITSVPMLIAEEMDADWSRVRTEILPLRVKPAADKPGKFDHAFVPQFTGGSTSIHNVWEPLRRYGAQARWLLREAAARQWSLPAEGLETKDSHVVDPKSGRKIAYGALIERLADIDYPAEEVAVKKPGDYRLIGTSQPVKDARAIVTGQPLYTMDADLPGMVHAMIARAPCLGGAVKAVDDAAARAVPGVIGVEVVERPAADSPFAKDLVAGVAVIAENLWAAKKGREALKIDWDMGPFADFSSAGLEQEMDAKLNAGGDLMTLRDEGDAAAAIEAAEIQYEARYHAPYVAHVTMEPHSCVADIRADGATVVIGHQMPMRVAQTVQAIAGLPVNKVDVQVKRMGGGFGRRFETDYAAEAILLSHRLGRPVKVTWTREDDIMNDRYRDPNVVLMRAGLSKDGAIRALHMRYIGPAHSRDRHKVGHKQGFWAQIDFRTANFPPGLVDHLKAEIGWVPSNMHQGFWRAPGSVAAAIPQQCFLDELAHRVGMDPLDFQLKLLGAPRALPVDPNDPEEQFDTGRMAAVLKLAADKAGWRQPKKPGVGRGLAGYYSHHSYAAQVFEIAQEDGRLVVERVVAAVDCGRVVNELGLKAQVEGSIHDGLSVTLGQALEIEGGVIRSNNFDSYQMMRIDAAPRRVEVHYAKSDLHPTGMGEPSVVPTAPALLNAIFDLTGKRLRRIPVAGQL